MTSPPNTQSNTRTWSIDRIAGFGLLRTGFAMAAAQGINILIGLALAILLARGLGVSNYGLYVYALALVQMLSMPVQMGLPTLVTRQVAVYRSRQDWASLEGLVRWSIGLVALTFAVITLIAIGYSVLVGVESDIASLAGFCLVLIALLGFMQIARALLAGCEHVFLSGLPDTVVRPLLLLALVVVVQHSAALSPALVMGLHALAAFAALIAAAELMRRYTRLRATPAIERVAPRFHGKAWLKSLLPLSLISGAAVINSKLDVAMLGAITGTHEVGIYTVAMQLAGLILVTQMIMGAIIGPRIARLHAEGDTAQINRIGLFACRVAFLGALLCVTVIALFGDRLIEVVFGPAYAPSYGVALIASIGYAFNASVGLVALILNMTGHERATLRAVGISVGINVVLNAVLIPLYGAGGAAAATSVSVIISQALLWNMVRTVTGLRTDIWTLVWPKQHSAARAAIRP